ncbi:MAG TPA: TonB-dependent receptor, partial [Elusimicrobiales bacterium]|nr:TonB-dependent receptor [Elusimicrobiales bacterium]
ARYDGNRRRDNDGDRRIYEDRLSPGLSVVYAPSFDWKFSARAARAFQAPTFADLYDPFVPAADRSANLRPERSINYHAGARWNSASGLYAGAGGYYSLIKDRIGLDANRSFAAYNMESAFNRGLESELGYKAGRLELSGVHTYNLSRGRTSGGRYRSIAFSPLHRAALTARLRAGAAGFMLRARHTAKQYTGRAHTGLRIPDYTVADARASYRAGVFEIAGGAENVLDRHYAETADTANGYYPQPGRVWTISLKAAF